MLVLLSFHICTKLQFYLLAYLCRNYLPFRSTWVHPRILVGFVLLDL